MLEIPPDAFAFALACGKTMNFCEENNISKWASEREKRSFITFFARHPLTPHRKVFWFAFSYCICTFILPYIHAVECMVLFSLCVYIFCFARRAVYGWKSFVLFYLRFWRMEDGEEQSNNGTVGTK